MRKIKEKPIEKTTLSEMTGRDEHDPTYTQFVNDDPVSDLISLKAIDELLNMKKLKTISRVKFEQVPILSKLFLFSDTFGENFTKKLANYILELQISTNGLGRRELVQLVQQRSELSLMDQPKQRSKEIFR